jgi:organic hydroperoxide reductase OsmC/OhrA
MAHERTEHVYRVTAWWTSGRTGIATSDSAPNVIHFSVAPDAGGLEGRWTPIELLLASVAGCFTTTFRTIASSAKYDFADLEVEATVIMPKTAVLGEIVIGPILKIADPEESEHALDLLRKAERLCLVSRALDLSLRCEPQVQVVQVEFAG